MVSIIWGASGLHPLSAKDHRQALAETGATEQSVLRVSTASQPVSRDQRAYQAAMRVLSLSLSAMLCHVRLAGLP